MPLIGYGTYQTPACITEQCVRRAIHVGYRLIDTAQCYGNERGVGLASGLHKIWKNPTLLAIAERHRRSVSQIALRFLTQQGIVAIPKSTSLQHMKENLASSQFDLAPAEMQALEGLEEGRSLFGWW